MAPTPSRHRAARLGALVGALVLAPLAASPAPGQDAKKSDAYVKVAARAAKPDASGNQVVTVTMTIDRAWHAYANPVGHEQFEDAATKLTVAKAASVRVAYPPGKLYKDKLGEEMKVYEGTVNIRAIVKRAPGDTDPLEVVVKFQVCNDKVCLPQSTVKLSVP